MQLKRFNLELEAGCHCLDLENVSQIFRHLGEKKAEYFFFFGKCVNYFLMGRNGDEPEASRSFEIRDSRPKSR